MNQLHRYGAGNNLTELTGRGREVFLIRLNKNTLCPFLCTSEDNCHSCFWSLLAACGCKMEITQRDVYTIHHNIPKARRYVEIIREEIENNWK